MSIDGIVGSIIGKYMPGVSGISSGRGSFQAVWEIGLTKLSHGTVGRMSKKVMAKGISYGLTDGLIMDIYYGIKQAINKIKDELG